MGMGSVDQKQGRSQWIGEPGHGRRQKAVDSVQLIVGGVAPSVGKPTAPPCLRTGEPLGEELFPPTGRGCAWANLYWRKWEHGPAWVLG